MLPPALVATIIIHVTMQLGTGGYTQKAQPVCHKTVGMDEQAVCTILMYTRTDTRCWLNQEYNIHSPGVC